MAKRKIGDLAGRYAVNVPSGPIAVRRRRSAPAAAGRHEWRDGGAVGYIPPMRYLAVMFLALAIVWQSLAPAGPGLLAGDGSGVAHALMHWHDAPHEHHDGGTTQDHPSGEGILHVVLDGSGPIAALVLETSLVQPSPRRVDAGTPRPAVALPEPYLEGPRRPPRLV